MRTIQLLTITVAVLILASDRLTAVDCNGTGIPDTEDIANGSSEDCDLDDVPDECERAPLPYRSLERIAFDETPIGLHVADVNDDGRNDLLVGYIGGVSIRLNNGGRDVRGYPEEKFDVGDKVLVWVVDAGDLDRDGDVDLAIGSSGGLSVLFNEGDGTFESPISLLDGIDIRFLSVGDLNGDGATDLVWHEQYQSFVSVLLSRGDRQFAEPVNYPVPSELSGFAVVDIDGDDDLDLVTANKRARNISLLLNAGDGSFPVEERIVAGGEVPLQLVADDFNNDGHVDLVVLQRSDLAILMGEEGATFTAALPLFFEMDRAETLTSGDVDGDGAQDLVVGFENPPDPVVFFNDGEGTFRALLSLDAGIVPRALRIADLDGDGAQDMLVHPTSSSDSIVIWNDESLKKSFLAFEFSTRHLVRGEPHCADIGDIDGDGDFDIVTGNNNDGTISVIVNVREGVFASRTFPSSSPAFSLVLDDFDGDGDLDVATVALNHHVAEVYLNFDGLGIFGRSTTIEVGQNPFHVTAGDFDGNGFPDLITANSGDGTISLLLNDGTVKDGAAQFTRQDINVGSRPLASAAADFDGDGHLDIAVANNSSSELSIAMNQGGASFQVVQRPVLAAPNFVVAGDFDADGHVDLATTSFALVDDDIVLFWNDGEGSFSEVPTVDSGTRPYSATTADVDADGFLDLITISEVNNRVAIVLNAGDRSFSSTVRPVGQGPRYVVAGDLEPDGDVDIVGANRVSEDITVLRNRSNVNQAPLYLESICTAADFYEISVPSRQLKLLATKYVAPAHDDELLLPTVFQNVNRVALHEEFLPLAFPERFPVPLSGEEFKNLVGRRETRDYYVGTLERILTGGPVDHVFTVVADTGSDVGQLLDVDEVEWVHQRLSEAFDLAPLAYRPASRLERRKAETWPNPPFPIFTGELDPGIEYEAYTVAVGYGRLRLMTLEEFNESAGRFTFQDIIVVEEAPADIEGVVGGVITGAVQGPLSHVAIRTARRGTPNAFVVNALEEFAPFADQLVRLEVFPTEYFVAEAKPEDAEAFWATNRPEPPELPGLDRNYGGLDHLFTMDLTGAVARFGGKATNLARLQRVLTGEYSQYREEGFAIPMRYYLEFMERNVVNVDGRELSYAQYLQELMAEPEFQTDSLSRFETLKGFRDLVRAEGVVDPELIATLAVRIEEVFGSSERMVRFRSSSNAEDALVFNGAGLYESTSVCAADTLDPASPDASFCDPTRESERTIERALKKVWSSLWTFRAHEERTFFQIPPDELAMGILVNRAFLDEAANGVAFTGNPSNPQDRRFMITAQAGEASVVSPEPGTTVERTFLEVVDGDVERTFRDRSSSLVPPGESVLSDAQLKELGALMAHIDAGFPLKLGVYPRSQVLLDFEFKIEPDGSLAVKQVRPFLISQTVPSAPTFELEVPFGTTVCGVFGKNRTDREPEVEYETKSIVHFMPGKLELPGGIETFSADLIESVVYGPDQLVAEPLERGLFRVSRIDAGNETTYRFDYQQQFVLPGGEVLDLEMLGLSYRGRGEIALTESRTLDEEFITFDMTTQGELDGVPSVTYSSCSYVLLPRWEIEVDLGGGSSVRIEERFLASESALATGPAALMRGEVLLQGESQTVTDYWRLVYAARRHNLDVRYWVVLDPPLARSGLERLVHAIEIGVSDATIDPDEIEVTFLDEDFTVLARLERDTFAKVVLPTELSFRRGDVDASGGVNTNDAVALLGQLFEGGGVPSCRKATDANDDGEVNVSDAVSILMHLFGGAGPLPEPQECGVDPTPDALSCEREICG